MNVGIRVMLDMLKPVQRVVDEVISPSQVPCQGRLLFRIPALSSQVQHSSSELALDCVFPAVLTEPLWQAA